MKHRLFKKTQNFYLNLKLSKKILLLMLILIIIPVTTIICVAYSLSAITIKKQTGDLIASNMDVSVSNITKFFENYDDVIRTVYTDNECIEKLNTINQWGDMDYYIAKNELNKKLRDIAYNKTGILGIAIVGKNGDVNLYDSLTESEVESNCFDIKGIKNSQVVQKVLNNKETIYTDTKEINNSDENKIKCFYIAHRLTDFNNYSKGAIGCILLCINEETLRNVYSDESFNNDVGKYDTSLIIGSDGDIISYIDNKYIGTNLFRNPKTTINEKNIKQAAIKFYKATKNDRHTSLSINVKKIVNGNFYLVSMQNLKHSFENLWFITGSLILIGMAVVFLCIYILLCFSDSTNKSVSNILKGMDAAHRDKSIINLDTYGNDEFAQITRHFNRMIVEMVSQEKREKEYMEKVKNAEIRSLEAQINPHFIYNTLDAINWVALEHKDTTTSHMIKELAELLRFSIANSNTVITIKEEVHYLKKYIYLQQQRFEYAFTCSVQVDADASDCLIHKLLIQPLLENVFSHAFPGETNMDEVNIKIFAVDEARIGIKVSDNGRGIEKEKLEQLIQLSSRDKVNKSKSEQEMKTEVCHAQKDNIGMANVITRLRLYYGESADISITSKSGKTVVYLEIPKRKG